MNTTYYNIIMGTVSAIVLVFFFIGMVKDAKEGMKKLREKEADFQQRNKQGSESLLEH